MNSLSGHITHIETSGNLSVVQVAVDEQITLKSIVIETSETASYLRVGTAISVLFKETEVIISTGETDTISLQNKIPAKIRHIEQGKLLSKLTLETAQGNIESIISTNSVLKLGLEPGKNVTAMIKLNEVMLREI